MSDQDSNKAATHKEARAQAKMAKAAAKASRPWYRKKRYLGLIAVVAVGAVVSTTGGGDETTPVSTADGDMSSGSSPSKPSKSQTPSKTSDATEAKLNSRVRDGKFEFTVKKVDCGKTSVGDQYVNAKAQGKFCMVNVKVENIANEPQSLFGDNQYLYDGGGRKFSADTEASSYVEDGADTIFEEINPGNSINGVVVFDVPKNVTPARIELHDSAFSSGVEVSLK